MTDQPRMSGGTAPGPEITFAAGKRHKLLLVFGVLSGILDVMFLAGGICAGAAGNIIAGISFGPLVFAAARAAGAPRGDRGSRAAGTVGSRDRSG